MPKRLQTTLPYLLLLVITATIYGRAITYGFIRWDDQKLVSENPRLNPPSLANVAHFWARPYAGLYTPISFTVWSTIAAISPNAGQFHALNVLLHLICIILVFCILKQLLSEASAIETPWPAFFGAMIFAMHPLQVEPIAWVSGMNNLLAGALSLLAILLYLKPRKLHFSLATIAFILALLAKPTAIVVPLIVVAIDLLILHRPLRRTLLCAGFWLLLAIPEILITRNVQPLAFVPPPLLHRPIIALDAIGFYLQKLIIPINLCIDYGRNPNRLIKFDAFHVIMPLVVLLATLLLLLLRRTRWLVASLLIFLAALLPTLGLAPFEFQEYSTTADRYVYLAMLGPALAIAWIVSQWPRPAAALAGIAIIALGCMSIYQLSFWQDTQTLTLHALMIDPGSAAANSIRGTEFSRMGYPEKAIPCYRAALLRIPADAALHLNLANALLASHQLDQARDEYLIAIQRLDRENLPPALNNLGLVYINAGDRIKAEVQFRAALKIDPAFPPALQNLRGLQMPSP